MGKGDGRVERSNRGCYRGGIKEKMITFHRIKNAFNILKNEGWVGIKYHWALVRDKEKGKRNDCHKVYDICFIEEGDAERFGKEGVLKPIVFDEHIEPLVSILIPVYNQAIYTYYCLQSIKKYTKNIPYEIIIGDDCSTDISKEMERWIKGVHIIHHHENYQFLKNCNKISVEAKGKYIVFLNNDTQVQQGWLEALVGVMEADKNIGLAGSKLVYPDGLVQEAGGIVWKDGYVLQYGNGRQAGEAALNFKRVVDYISGAAIIVRRELWEKIEGFDERFAPAYYEDVDLAFQVRERGYQVVYQPDSEVVHFEGVTERMDDGRMIKIETNRKLFHEKWNKVLEKQHYKKENYTQLVNRMEKYS